MKISVGNWQGRSYVVWYDAVCLRCGQQVTDMDSDLSIDTATGEAAAIHKNAMICEELHVKAEQS